MKLFHPSSLIIKDNAWNGGLTNVFTITEKVLNEQRTDELLTYITLIQKKANKNGNIHFER